jgi:fucose permease
MYAKVTTGIRLGLDHILSSTMPCCYNLPAIVSMNLQEEFEQTIDYTERSPLWLSGFLPLGVLIGLLGSLVVTWQYHIDVEPQIIGLHFLALSIGYVLAAAIGQRWVRWMPLRTLALLSCGLAVLSLIALGLLGPPVQIIYRIFGAGLIGVAAGALSTALLYASEPYFADAPAAAANVAGSLLGSGCLLATIIAAVTYSLGPTEIFGVQVAPLQLQMALLAIFPGIFFVLLLANRFPLARLPIGEREEDMHREMLRDLRSIATVLFSLLLFFQFGNEWAIAGWLPLFLIHRFGINPAWAIGILAFYFFALMFGRLVAQALLEWFNHRRLLLGSILLAMVGYVVLSFAHGALGALLAVAIIGAGYAPIYPLIAERLDDRFSYHPGFWNGTVSIAITGAMCAPWALGYVDQFLGVQYVMVVPAIGSVAVCILAILLMFEARLMGEKRRDREPEPLISADDV